VAQNRPFVDGNERTAFAATLTVLASNAVSITADAPATHTFIVGPREMASFRFDPLEAWLCRHTAPMCYGSWATWSWTCWPWSRVAQYCLRRPKGPAVVGPSGHGDRVRRRTSTQLARAPAVASVLRPCPTTTRKRTSNATVRTSTDTPIVAKPTASAK